MFLEGLGEDHGCQFTRSILSSGRQGFASVFQISDIPAEIAGACPEDDADVAVWWLGAKSGGEDTEEMEVREVVNAPIHLELLLRKILLAVARCKGIGAEDHHVEAAGRGIVNPFCGEETDGVQRGKINLFGVDEFVVGGGSHIVYVVYEEGVRAREVREEDDLGATGGKGEGYGGADARRAPLGRVSDVLEGRGLGTG